MYAKAPQRRPSHAHQNHHNQVERMARMRVNKGDQENELTLLDDEAWKAFINSIPADQHVWLTVANYGYLDLVLNLYYTIQRSCSEEARAKFVVLSPDRVLVNALKTWPCINTFYVDYKPWTGTRNEVSSNAVAFKRDDWNAITRFKLLAVWAVLESKRPVFYVDPDIAFVSDPSHYINGLRHDTMYLQEGDPYCTGVIVARPSMIATELFNPVAWKSCGQDDETYTQTAVRHMVSKKKIPQSQFQTLDFKLFPNGKVWRDDPREGVQRATVSVAEKQCILFHFNHISGIDAKIDRMKGMRCFFPIMKVAKVPDQFRPSLTSVCIEKNGSTYPPHHGSYEDHLEEACERLVKETMKTRLISSPRTYLPIHWTAVAVTKNTKLLHDLQDWCSQFFSTHKKESFWSVVQHCKGLFGSCGVTIPTRMKLFMTSDPNGALSLSFNPNKRRSSASVKAATGARQAPDPKVEAIKRATQTQHNGVRNSQPSNMDMHRILRHNQAWARARGKHEIPKLPKVKTPRSRVRPPRRNTPVAVAASRSIPTMPELGMEKHWITVPLVSGKHHPSSTPVQRTVLASFMGSIDVHPIRHQLQQEMQNVEDIVVQSGAYRNESDVRGFQELMQKSVFALCPRGFGTTSFRLTEAMDYGCIPVYISDTFSIPFSEHLNIQEVCILVSPNQIKGLAGRLRSIPPDEIARLRENIKQYRDRFFTMEGCCKTIVFDYIDGQE